MSTKPKPKEPEEDQGFFDRFAGWADGVVSRAPFFVVCAAFVLAWCSGLYFAGWDNDIYHLLLNSPTTAITFLIVSLSANAARRESKATNAKLDAIAAAVADLLDDVGGEGHDESIERLRKSVGLEDRIGA